MTRVTVPVPVGAARYDVLVGDDLLEDAGRVIGAACPASRYAVVSDRTVAPLYAESVRAALARHAPTSLFTFPAGEAHKTRRTWTDLTDQLLAGGVGRDAAIVAVGGGVVGDVAGFLAATYLRGVPYVQVPTTLLAMIDASVGGKTGVDTPAGKNLVGAFYQPRLVVADVTALASLPREQVTAGLAEALKHGIIADAEYFARLVERHEAVLAGDPATLIDTVGRSVAIKAAVVSDDERERGRRAMLNFGHTIGHALEALTGFELLHGRAIAVGMAVEAELGTRAAATEPEVTVRLREGLDRFGLPTTMPDAVEPEALLEFMHRDKKVRAGTVRFALPQRVGSMARDAQGEWTIPVAETTIRAVLADLRRG